MHKIAPLKNQKLSIQAINVDSTISYATIKAVAPEGNLKITLDKEINKSEYCVQLINTKTDDILFLNELKQYQP